MNVYDVVICGAGVLGASCAYALSKLNLTILCLDRWNPPHLNASSSGESRLFRTAYFEDMRYIPLLLRAHAMWRELEQEQRVPLFCQNGFLLMSPKHDIHLHAIKDHARQFDIALDHLTARTLVKRFPQFQPPSSWEGTLEINAGVINAERAVQAFLTGAMARGVTVHGNETIVSFDPTTHHMDIITNRSRYRAAHVVLALGAYCNHFAQLMPMPITITRAVQFWFPCQTTFHTKNTPCFAFADEHDFIYGFPALSSRGAKVARYQGFDHVQSPLHARAPARECELAPVQHVVKNYLPMLDAQPSHHHVCFYASTKDENFLLDHHPDFPRVILAGGDSGHAFKFAPVIGETIRALIAQKPLPFDTEFLRCR